MKEVKSEKVVKSKILTIDVDAEDVVNFKGNLGISDTITMLQCLNDLQKQFQEHLVKQMVGSHIVFGQKCARLKEMDERLSGDDAVEKILEIWKGD